MEEQGGTVAAGPAGQAAGGLQVEASCLPPSFIGDGCFKEDGGASLQVLWQLYPWRPIPRCPGRYVSPDRDLRHMTVEVVVQRLHERLVELSGATEQPAVTAPIVSLQIPGRDMVQTARFLDGGGLFTYVKADGVHVHSLNTESGYARKLEALGLDWRAAYVQAEDPMQAKEKNDGAFPVGALAQVVRIHDKRHIH